MELLERYVRGDLDAFECVFRQHQSTVHGWIVRVVRDPAEAEDLTIETFWRIYRSRGSFNTQRECGGWAHRVAVNLAYNHLRDSRRMSPLQGHLLEPSLPPEENGEGLEECVRQAVGELPERLRELAVLVLIEERSHLEVARMLGVSVGAVKSRVFRGVRFQNEATGTGSKALKETNDDELKADLRAAFAAPTQGGELERDLWPRMLRRLRETPAGPAWLDWFLAGAAGGWLVAFPQVIPSLL